MIQIRYVSDCTNSLLANNCARTRIVLYCHFIEDPEQQSGYTLQLPCVIQM